MIEVGVRKTACIDWHNFLREVCEQHMRRHPIQLGGVGVTVEIDESYFFHRKYHRGQVRPGRWVFGAVERGTSRTLLVEVPDRTRATLEALIVQWILPGSRIIFDAWAAYANLGNLPQNYVHQFVVHQHNFVDPGNPDIHTNHVESMWQKAKRKPKHQFGTSRQLFQSYLDEFIWLQKKKRLQQEAFPAMINSIREEYPV